ncbi:type II toxin-antitoxin system ParD family antitoxin [Rhizobium sp. AN80A]|uniref:type II toxin-antitoxin system ParD family antitoxin n=1 Tax=Rhizobium sp. AN80A TaxID=3040673 RepID=UPI0024B37B5D|nr:type II toxin-antitoxin system ParD family antitoxin [Rhizobium sp. AN80A]
MIRVMSVTIDDRMEDFIEEQLGDGRYASAGEVIDHGLQLLRDQAEIEAIRAAIIEGEQSGEPEEFDGEAFLKEVHRKYIR